MPGPTFRRMMDEDFSATDRDDTEASTPAASPAPPSDPAGPDGLELIEPTADERRNGWTAETLTAYHRKRRIAQHNALDPATRKKPKPRVANGRYNPLKWNR